MSPLFIFDINFKLAFYMGESAISRQMVTKSDDSLILTAPVMIPNFHDCDFDRGETPLSVEQITDFRHRFEDYGFVDKHHSIRGPNVTKDHLVGSVLKSFQLDNETSYAWVDGSVHTYPPGTWMITSEITDKTAIKEVQNGQITGYSASVFNDKVAKQIRASLKASEGDLIKDVTDPTVAVVSLVRKPCVSDAKFCKCNLKGEKMSEDTAKSKLDSISKILGLDKTEYASKGDVEDLKSDLESAMKSYKEEIAETVDKAIKSALTEFAIKESKEDEEDEEDEEEETENTEDESEETETSEETNEETSKDENKKAKGSAKGQKIHNGTQEVVTKSDSQIVYDIMGRSADGRPLKQ